MLEHDDGQDRVDGSAEDLEPAQTPTGLPAEEPEAPPMGVPQEPAEHPEPGPEAMPGIPTDSEPPAAG